jgi:hypothetical protein
MTSIQVMNMLKEPDFRSLVEYYCLRAAEDVFNESGGAPNHAARLALALQIAANAPSFVDRFGRQCILNATIKARANLAEVVANEADIQFVVNSTYDRFI